MPEGDTIHKVAAAIAPLLLNRTLTGGRLREHPDTGFSGWRVTDVTALGKHLFIQFSGGLLLRSHLGMYGSWHRYRPREPWRKSEWAASVVLETEDWVLVCFNAAAVELLEDDGFGARDWRRRLGPDLLGADLDMDAVVLRARGLADPNVPLVDLLLDQKVAAGIGNVYKSELLFIERLPPAQKLGDTPDERLCAVYREARRLLKANLKRGFRRTRFDTNDHGRLWVYKRGGRPCLVCGTPIASGPLGRHLRPTFWCPECQKEIVIAQA